MAYSGNNLAFLVSQPRAGSTMLQRILGGHSEIHTLPEPWFLLPLCAGLNGEALVADYALGGWAHLAEQHFFEQLGGRGTRVEAIRALAEVVYGKALADSGKHQFLDKTPRYYYVLSELAELFPEARFILLYRNPLAVLCSIIRTWIEDHWERMAAYRDDLLVAPRSLVNGRDLLGDRAVVVHYESLVEKPEETVSGLCASLGLQFEDDILDYGRTMNQPMAFGDPGSVSDAARPQTTGKDRWQDDLRDPRIWRLASDYLKHLGVPLIGQMGYAYDELATVLRSNRPGVLGARLSAPLLRLLEQGGHHAR